MHSSPPVRLATRSLAAVALFVLPLAVLGCASPEADEPVGTSSHAIAQSDFSRRLEAIQAKYDRCIRDGECRGTATAVTDTDGIGEQSIRPQGVFDLFGGGIDVCDVLRPFGGLEHAYFFVGASVTGAAIATGTGGVDLVWDLWNKQAATFGYVGGGITSLVGGEAGAYMGYGFGNKSSVVDAWSGVFISAGLSAGLPVLKLAAGASGFSSPDASIVGGAVNVSIGFDFIPTPVDGAFIVGKWTPWDGATSAFRQSLWFVSSTVETAAVDGHDYEYVQFAGADDLSLSIVETTGVTGASAAAQALALGILRDQGLTISQLCD